MSSSKYLKARIPGGVYQVDANQWDFNLGVGKAGLPTNDIGVHKEDLTDIVLTKDRCDYTSLVNQSLFTVGGYLHLHDGNKINGIFLIDGLATSKKLKSNHIGIINFEEINCNVNLFTMNTSNLFPLDDHTKLYKGFIVKLPPGTLDSPLVGVSILGSVIFPHLDKSESVKVISDSLLKIDLSKCHLLERLFHLKKIFPKVNDILTNIYLDGRIKVSDVTENDDVIKALMGLSQSFIFTLTPRDNIGNKTLRFEMRMVGDDNTPHRYYSTLNGTRDSGFHHQPLLCSDGRLLPYSFYDDRNGIELRTEWTRVYPQQNDDMFGKREDLTYLTEKNMSAKEGVFAKAHLLNIYWSE